MAISTYSELQTAVQNWLDNTNTIPVARVQEFIALGEADIRRRIRVRENLAAVSGLLVAAEPTLSLPSDFGGIDTLSVTDNGYERPLAQLAPNVALEQYYAYGSGVPAHYVVEGGSVRLYPTPDSAYTYTLRYWQRVPALTDAAPSNWLLTDHPDVYLFGSLIQAELFLVDDPRVPLWQAKYEAAIEQVIAQSALDSIGRTDMQTQGGTP
jgi:hypothetical protein